MKLAIISDIHSNYEALTAVLDAIAPHNVDAIYCLGDIVGYGADPKLCVDLVRANCAGAVMGNHDIAVAKDIDMDYLPSDGRTAALHNREALEAEHIAYLADLPFTLEADGCTFVHATPHMPQDWQRVGSFFQSKSQFQHFSTDVCFVGHTHIPAIMANKIGVLHVRSGHRFIINTGSVGQPRDGNPQAGFGIFDLASFTYDFIRVPYNVDRAAAKIKAAGLPRSLSRRLFKGQ